MIQRNDRIDNLVDALGEGLFTDMVSYTAQLSEDKYDYKILMGRRFFAMYSCLDEVIQMEYRREDETYGEFVTNLSIAIKDFRNKKILIVDDTFLHGRAIKSIIKDLKDGGCKEENIHVKVFLRNEDANICDKSLLSLIEPRRQGDANRWHFVSGKIIEGFMAFGQPYISWLPYYRTDEKSDYAKRIRCFIERERLKNVATATQKEYLVSSYVHSGEGSFSMCRSNLIRFYEYGQAKEVLLIPYAYLKPLERGQLSEFFKICQEKEIIESQEKIDFLCNLEELENSALKSRYAYSLLTYIISLLLGMRFLTRLGLEDWRHEKSIEKRGLGCNIKIAPSLASELILKFENIGVIEEEKIVFDGHIDPDREALIGEVKGVFNARGKKISAKCFLDNYLKKSSELDEERAKSNQERLPGLAIEQIWEHTSDKKETWEKLQEVIDTGQGTLSVGFDKIGKTEYVDSLLYAGELNYSCNEENLVCFIYPLMQYELYCRDHGISNDDTKVGKQNLISAIKKAIPELSESVSVLEESALVEESLTKTCWDYYYGKYSIYQKDGRVLKGMELEKKKEEMWAKGTENDGKAVQNTI